MMRALSGLSLGAYLTMYFMMNTLIPMVMRPVMENKGTATYGLWMSSTSRDVLAMDTNSKVSNMLEVVLFAAIFLSQSLDSMYVVYERFLIANNYLRALQQYGKLCFSSKPVIMATGLSPEP